jgi:hypothetical protein
MIKISQQMRRGMLLDLEEKGMSHKELKIKYGISDNRTLKKHLDLAEREREARQARIKILADNQAEHLGQLRQLIENWKAGIRIQPVTIPPSTMAQFFQSLQSNLLFNSLRSHLPFPAFWRQYSDWEAKYRLYIAGCEQLRSEIQQIAIDKTKLNFQDDISKTRLSRELIEWVLNHVQHKLDKKAAEKVEFRWHTHKIQMDKNPVEARVLVALGHGELLAVIGKQEFGPEFYEDKCRVISSLVLKTETVANLSTLFDDLHNLESKIQDSLEEILLRRDYIMYTCKYCPGQPRVLR